MKSNFQFQLKRQLMIIPVFLVMVALFVQGCGEATPTATATPAPAATQPPLATAVPPTPTPAFAGTLRVAYQPLVKTDPALISSDPEIFVANAVYDYLVDVTPANR